MADHVTTLGCAVDEATAALTAAGCEAPRADAEAIAASVLELDPLRLSGHSMKPVHPTAEQAIGEGVIRRREHEPLEYITGRCSFRGLELAVDARVLVPLASFGPLVEVALSLPHDARVHDVGTGSGAIALAIKNERSDLIVGGSDLSPAAVSVARANAVRLELEVDFCVADGLPPGEYDLVTANLPFEDDAGQTIELAPETTDYQPHVAVFGGPDGLAVIRAFVDATPSGTMLAMSCAPSQLSSVRHMFADAEELPGATQNIAFLLGRTR